MISNIKELRWIHLQHMPGGVGVHERPISSNSV
jgi:hypothetical protein